MLKRILSLTLAAVLALAVFATAAFAEAIDEGVIYFVYTENGKDLNVRNAPNGEIIGSLHYGEEVKVTAIINDYWALIEFHDNVPGYVSSRFLVPVHPDEIKKAIEEIFDVTVIKVTTTNVRGREKRQGAYPAGKTASWKKAVVKLSAESKNIELFEGMA